jgi:hypothetical protein
MRVTELYKLLRPLIAHDIDAAVSGVNTAILAASAPALKADGSQALVGIMEASGAGGLRSAAGAVVLDSEGVTIFMDEDEETEYVRWKSIPDGNEVRAGMFFVRPADPSPEIGDGLYIRTYMRDGTDNTWLAIGTDLILTGGTPPPQYVFADSGFATNRGVFIELGLNVGSVTGAGTGDIKLAGSIIPGTSPFTVRDSGDARDTVRVNDSSDATAGSIVASTVLDQAATDGPILAFTSSDVAHGATDFAPTATYATFGKSDAAGGGLLIRALSDNGVAPFNLRAATLSTIQTTKATSSVGAIYLNTSKISGTGMTDHAANSNLLTVANNSTVRFILDADGDSHQDVGTAWTNFSTHDDVALLTTLSLILSKPADPIRGMFGNFLEEHRQQLESLGIVTFNDDGHHFANMSKLLMLTIGAVMQSTRRIAELERRLLEAPCP